MAEPAGDFARNAAAMVEAALSGDRAADAVVVVAASAEYHDPPARHCPMLGVAKFLAAEYARLARETGTDAGLRLARWRQAADYLDSGGAPGA